MKTKYKHIHFVAVVSGLKNKERYKCMNNKSSAVLGEIFYYTPWRKYVFAMTEDAVFDDSCLRDVINFLEQLKK